MIVVLALALGGCGDDDGSSDASTPDAPGVDAPGVDAPGVDAPGVDAPGVDGGPPPTGAHPLYPDFDLDDLPEECVSSIAGPYQVPELPVTTRTVTITTTGRDAAQDVLAACEEGGVLVDVPDAAGRIDALTLGGVDDCDVQLGPNVRVDTVVVGSLFGPMHAPSHRVRVRGGSLGSISVHPQTTDVVFDGVIVNDGLINMTANDEPDGFVDRFAFINSIFRAVESEPDGMGNTDGALFLGTRSRNVFFANNNIVTAGNRNSWGWRLNGGSNYILVDNVVRVSFHKLVRFNSADTDCFYTRGGTWMRELTLTASGADNNDVWAALNGDGWTDHIYIHDTEVYLLNPRSPAVGPTFEADQAGRSWEMRNITWHALNEDVISDESLEQRAMNCVAGQICDFGVGTHTYDYDPALTFPADPWRTLPTIANGNPDDLPLP